MQDTKNNLFPLPLCSFQEPLVRWQTSGRLPGYYTRVKINGSKANHWRKNR
jgi:hypothetical protein